ncbi:MAG: hypothetical protein V4608_01545 [Bacteroidota bacterium]
MENVEILNENETPKRPVFLTVLCILTFISSGIGSVTALLTPLFSETIIEFLQNSPNYDEAEMAETVAALQAGFGFYLMVSILAVCSLVGAILMWKLKKIGFHIYAISNLVALFIPMLMLSTPISWPGIVITAIFISMYAVHLKLMN